ncbi:MAG: prefoldin subunit beta [Candidatus Aenigmarchaeota archaeon]|nr:prefoldin subunit beta [Candidatus Aenigmarchaeota archaeon]
MSELKITPETQQIFMELQAYQQQMQNVMMQKESLNIQNMEIDKALSELGKVKDEDVFKAVGPILIKSEKGKLTKELEEKKETIDLRLKSLHKQETRMKERMEESQKKLEELLGASQSAAAE